MNLLGFLFRKKFSLPFIYCDDYWTVDMGTHVFPIKKYRYIYEKLLRMGARKGNFFQPLPAREEDVLLVHTAKYLKKLKTGSLSQSEIATMELPFSAELVKFALLMVGGTILAAEKALEVGIAVHIGGGFHHAFPDHGEGFCVLNDVAVAVERLKQHGKIQRAMVVDCDVHHGNGTAFIFAKKNSVFTFSLHQMDLYPAEKPPSSVDEGLWSGDGDGIYLAKLRRHFPRLYREFKPELIFYLAGADPYEGDKLGGLKITKEGLKERDRIVIEGARKLHLPVAIVLGGGYAYDVEDTVSIHMNTIKVAQEAQKKSGSRSLTSFLSPAS